MPCHLAAALTLTVAVGSASAHSFAQVHLTEFLAQNDSVLADDDGDFSDWIELRNLTPDRLDLGGFFLTDDPSEPQQFQIPAGVFIEPWDRILFWADDDEDQGSVHTNFKLSSGGEYVGLFAPEALAGEVIDQVTFPALGDDAAYARTPDGRGPFVVEERPTPGEANGPADQGPPE